MCNRYPSMIVFSHGLLCTYVVLFLFNRLWPLVLNSQSKSRKAQAEMPFNLDLFLKALLEKGMANDVYVSRPHHDLHVADQWSIHMGVDSSSGLCKVANQGIYIVFKPPSFFFTLLLVTCSCDCGVCLSY
jgi:hypothetical protein